MKDKDFIKSKFDSENINAPDSLGEEKIRARLEQGTNVNSIVKLGKSKRRPLQRLAAIAACIALLIGTGAAVNAARSAYFNRVIESNTKNGIVHFTSYGEIENFTGKLDAVRNNNSGLFLPRFRTVFEKSETLEYAADGAAATENEAVYSETYNQVKDVNEADIVKTDGKYIYILNSTDNSVSIYSANGDKTELVSKDFEDEINADYSEMYVDGDRLYILGTDYTDGESNTFVRTLDITSREEFRELETYRQSGEYNTSRMTNGCIYVISNTYKFDKKYIPYCTDADGKFRKIPAEDICAFKCCEKPDYAVIGAINTTTGLSKDRKVKAVMGGASNVYCTTRNLYVSCYDYCSDSESTTIVKYSLRGINVKETAVGAVKGYINNQWSFDEKDGFLRVATTAYQDNGQQINTLFILDENLKKIGSVGGYAKGEHIEAVKYIGDMAYVITYETTDPLFCIDLADPKDPKITGEVKLDGFSTNLVPVSDNMLMGIGYATRRTPEWSGEERSGVKIVLFDISDKNAPKVLDEKIYNDYTSSAQETHKAIIQDIERNVLAIPMSAKSGYSGEALLFGEKNGKINIVKEQNTKGSVDRIVYIGDYFYAIDTSANAIEPFVF